MQGRERRYCLMQEVRVFDEAFSGESADSPAIQTPSFKPVRIGYTHANGTCAGHESRDPEENRLHVLLVFFFSGAIRIFFIYLHYCYISSPLE